MSDRRPPPTLGETELAAITPLEFVVARGDDGQPTLDVREGEFERSYNLQDPYSCWMFVALCRREGALVYRRRRQRAVTVCVKTTVSKHETLWQRFLALTTELDARLGAVTDQFVREHIETSKP